MRPSVLALPLLPLSHLAQLGRAPSSALHGMLEVFLLFSPNYHEEPEGQTKLRGASYTKSGVRTTVRKVWC